MKYTDRRAKEIAESTQSLETIRHHLSACTLEEYPAIEASFREALKRKDQALAMRPHVYDCFVDGEEFESPGRTTIGVTVIITRDEEGNILQEKHFAIAHYLSLCPKCTESTDPVKHLTDRWSDDVVGIEGGSK